MRRETPLAGDADHVGPSEWESYDDWQHRRQLELEARDDPPIYSPESTDGRTDWLSIAVSAVIFLILLALFIIGMNWALGPSKADAHSWYDPSCCSGTDCAPASPGDVSWTPAGWEVKSLKETVPFSSTKLRRTPIGEPPFHECVWRGLLTCLYVPEPQS